MQISPRTVGYVVGGVAVIVGGWLGLDQLIVTDEEQIEELANAVTGPVEDARIDAAIREWIDPATQPIEVTAFGQTELYDVENAAELATRAREALRSYRGERLRKLRQSIEVHDDRGRLSLRIVSVRGMVDADFDVRKHGDRWLVSAVSIHR